MRPHDDKSDGNPTRESPSAVEETRDDATLRLVAEELAVAKEKVETGRVHISTRTHEREALIDETLARERIEIETVAVGLQVDAVPDYVHYVIEKDWPAHRHSRVLVGGDHRLQAIRQTLFSYEQTAGP